MRPKQCTNMVRHTRSTNVNNVGQWVTDYYAPAYTLLERTRVARRRQGQAPVPNRGPTAGHAATVGTNPTPTTTANQPTTQPAARLSFMDIMAIGEIRTVLISPLDRDTVNSLRMTCWQLRSSIADVNCWNRRHWRYNRLGRHYNFLEMGNANPWSESSPRNLPRLRCNRSPHYGVGPFVQVSECVGHERLLSVRRQGHGPQFWTCSSCVTQAYDQYDHTRFPPWLHALCLPCSQVERLLARGRCQCKVDYSDWGPNDLWLCSDCRQEYATAVYETLLRGAERNVPVRDNTRPTDDILRWVHHGPTDRHQCRCGRTWAQTLQTYPVNNQFLTGFDLTQMYRQCLVCTLECSTTEPN